MDEGGTTPQNFWGEMPLPHFFFFFFFKPAKAQRMDVVWPMFSLSKVTGEVAADSLLLLKQSLSTTTFTAVEAGRTYKIRAGSEPRMQFHQILSCICFLIPFFTG